MFNTSSGGNLNTTVERFKQELDKLVDMTWSQGERAMDAFRQFRGDNGALMPPVDVIHGKDTLVLLVDLPGLTAADVELNLVGNVLSLRTATPPLRLEEGDRIHLRERPMGTIERQVSLPVPVDPERVQAEMKNGTLMITLQKANSARSIQIAVHGG